MFALGCFVSFLSFINSRAKGDTTCRRKWGSINIQKGYSWEREERMSHLFFSNLILRREWHVIGLEGRKEDYTLVTHMSWKMKTSKVQCLHVIFGSDVHAEHMSFLHYLFWNVLTVLCRHVNFHDISEPPLGLLFFPQKYIFGWYQATPSSWNLTRCEPSKIYQEIEQ